MIKTYVKNGVTTHIDIESIDVIQVNEYDVTIFVGKAVIKHGINDIDVEKLVRDWKIIMTNYNVSPADEFMSSFKLGDVEN